MHEFSVVQDFLRLCEEHVRANGCRRVVRARVKAGEFSGIELALFRRALEAFAPGSVLEGAEVICTPQPLCLRCDACGYDGEARGGVGGGSGGGGGVGGCAVGVGAKPARLVCPRCASSAVTPTDGEEFMLMQLEME